MDGVEMGTGGEKEVCSSTSSKFHSQIVIRQFMQPRPVFEDLLNKFWCKVPRGSLHVSSLGGYLGHQFGEFCINTDPDPEDFGDLSEKDSEDFEPIPELYLPTDHESEYSNDIVSIPVNAPSNVPASATVSNTVLCDGKLREPLTVLLAKPALKDLMGLLHPTRKKGPGYTDPEIDYFVRTRMEGMQSMLHFYTNPRSTTYEKWRASSYQAAISLGRGRYCARQLCTLVRQFVKNREVLPINPYGQWKESLAAFLSTRIYLTRLIFTFNQLAPRSQARNSWISLIMTLL